MAKVAWRRTEVRTDEGETVRAVAPVIISASRATDIPAFFSEWMLNRLRCGHVRWVNPFNSRPQYVSFADTRVIVFWTKNPKPMLSHLSEIDDRGINYYFQFTLNDYEGEGLEPNVPPLMERVETFRLLSERLGRKRVVWRFDPLVLTESLTVDALIERVARVAILLKGYTEKLVISFADIGNYKKVQNNLARNHLAYREFTPDLMLEFAEKLSRANQEWGLQIATCAEGVDLDPFGIGHNRCIDDDLLLELFPDDEALMTFLGHERDLLGGAARRCLKDKGQRDDCGCIVSKDIGMYDTCRHLCMYCYANTSCEAVEKKLRRHNAAAEGLVG